MSALAVLLVVIGTTMFVYYAIQLTSKGISYATHTDPTEQDRRLALMSNEELREPVKPLYYSEPFEVSVIQRDGYRQIIPRDDYSFYKNHPVG